MPEGPQIYLKKTPTQMFSCEYCEILRTAFLYKTPLMAGFHLSSVLAVSKFPQSHHENKKSKK